MSARFSLETACISVIGRIRSNNEDNLYYTGKIQPPDNRGMKTVISSELLLDEPQVFGVFDGMGGQPSGEKAAYLAALVLKKKCWGLKEYIVQPRVFLMDTIQKMNHQVFAAGQEAQEAMGTTAVLLYFHENEVYSCNVGDSKAFRMRGGGFQQISEDHTNRGFLEEQGIMGRKPSLVQYIGMSTEECAVAPFIAKGRLANQDQFLICSDGLTDMVSNVELCSLMKAYPDVRECAAQMIGLALERGGKDNITLILIKVHN